jgi:hypothetical protein
MGVQEGPRSHPDEAERTDQSPLSRDQLAALAAALARARGILRAARLAAFTGWTLLAIGILSLLVSLFSVKGVLVGCALLAVAWNELEGRKMILRFDPRGARRLARNQLWFLGVIVLYCVWSVYRARFHPTPEVAQVEELLELGPGFVANATSAFYGLVLVAGVAYQLATYRYHAARIRMVEEYVAETPPWIMEVQQVLQGDPGEGAARTLHS